MAERLQAVRVKIDTARDAVRGDEGASPVPVAVGHAGASTPIWRSASQRAGSTSAPLIQRAGNPRPEPAIRDTLGRGAGTRLLGCSGGPGRPPRAGGHRSFPNGFEGRPTRVLHTAGAGRDPGRSSRFTGPPR